MSYDRILRAARSMTWAIQPEKLEAILGFLELKMGGGEASEDVLTAIRSDSAAAAARTAAAARMNASGSVAVLPLYGILSHRSMGDISGPRGTAMDRWLAQFKEAVNNPSVSAIVIDCDSPGGSIEFIAEAADAVYSARSRKPITAVANCLMASAAYWICASASELVCSPSALVGSIGVFCAHEDDSVLLDKQGVKITLISAGRFKTEANHLEPLGSAARAAIQANVDDFYGMFTRAIARGRGVSVSEVRNGMGQGRMIPAQQAVTLKMADRVATLDQVLAKYVQTGNTRAIGGVGQRASLQLMRDQLRLMEIQ